MNNKLLGTAALLAGSLWTTSAASLQPRDAHAVSEQALVTLDPTRIARSACGGGKDTGATLEQRLRLAQELGDERGLGRAPIPLYSGISATQIPASNLDAMARRYFDQGVMLAYGFNHQAAIRSFREARRLAPDCAMCWWGEAMANGPNINAGMDSEQNRAALAALKEAQRLAGNASPEEQALIEAQVLRYSDADDANQAALDGAYADAMLALARRHPSNDDIAVLAAESAMNTTPWDYWDPATDEPRGRIGEAIALIETVMQRNPRHPQAGHLYVHLMENSADPKIAEAAADRLADSAPSALGHLVHMPAHIYHRIGRYRDSVQANVAGARADEAYLAEVGDDGLYRYGYYPHNVHFLLTSAQMIGALSTVTYETERLTRILDIETAKALPWVQAIHAAPAFALTQYASPDAILALTGTPSELAYVEAMRHYARALAHARKRDTASFDAELAAMDALAESDRVTAMVDAGFPAPDLVRLAALVARGKAAHLAGRYDAAVDLLEQAEAIERTIPYSEPAYWYYPVAQSRGAALYAAGRHAEAKDAFMKALVAAPNNGWALYGLEQTERKLGNRAQALAAARAFAGIWQGDKAWLRMDQL